MDVFGDDNEDGSLSFHDKSEDKSDHENDVFALSRENKEMSYAIQDMVDKIDKIEEEMLADKKW